MVSVLHEVSSRHHAFTRLRLTRACPEHPLLIVRCTTSATLRQRCALEATDESVWNVARSPELFNSRLLARISRGRIVTGPRNAV